VPGAAFAAGKLIRFLKRVKAAVPAGKLVQAILDHNAADGSQSAGQPGLVATAQ
jgi:hypothetical protein